MTGKLGFCDTNLNMIYIGLIYTIQQYPLDESEIERVLSSC